MHRTLAALAVLAATPAAAAPDQAALAERALTQAILPGYQKLAEATEILAAEADGACSGEGPIEAGPVNDAFNAAFDAWIAVESFRFGPAATAGIAGWPDSEAAIPKALDALAKNEDAVVDDRAAFAATPAADRGLFAAEYLLFDPAAPKVEGDAYSCRLLMAVTRNLADTSAAFVTAWQGRWGQALLGAGTPGDTDWKTREAATASLYDVLADGLAADADQRLGRPLGNDDPHAAEAWRSDRSLRNLELSLAALRRYAATVFAPALQPESAARVDAAFADALTAADHVGEPLEKAAATATGRAAATALQASVRKVEAAVSSDILPAFGIATEGR
jgi:predicted lipoprotein